MKLLKRILLILAVIFFIIQFIRPARNIVEVNPTNEVTAAFAVPDDVLDILKTSGYDCHSNNTRYLWYVNIQPIGWFMDSHIKEGKSKMNFSEFVTINENVIPATGYSLEPQSFFYVDSTVSEPGKYFDRIKQEDNNGLISYS